MPVLHPAVRLLQSNSGTFIEDSSLLACSRLFYCFALLEHMHAK
jgi:hypothetical protein